ncbi:MAG TPA: ATP-binding protein [Desulfomicrobiaceae bacterium]|nr:ATP-binding protein [Desulfomicrobiaceae bacterium]
MISNNTFTFHKRDVYLERITPFLGTPVIKVLVGMRRVGKSCLLQLLKEKIIAEGTPPENVLFVDKESLEFDEVTTYQDLADLVDSAFKNRPGLKTLLVDEVQEIIGWEKAVASFLGQGDMDIILTGSNAHLFATELATRLSGRYILFPIHSLTFSEFMNFRGDRAESTEAEFKRYLRYGGLPALHHMELNDQVVFQYINSIYNTILLKDIVSRHSIRHVSLLERIAMFLFDNIGQTLSANRIAAYLKSQRVKVSVDTVVNYLRYFQDALIAHKVSRFDLKGHKLLEVHEKYFLEDIGLRHAVLGFREADISQLLENIVFHELIHRGYTVSIGKLADREVDFIATREGEKIYVQVCYLLASERTITREFSPLLAIADNYPKFVLSMDPLFGDDYKGVRRIHLIDFLMQPSIS